jgi:hypothetical protein
MAESVILVTETREPSNPLQELFGKDGKRTGMPAKENRKPGQEATNRLAYL